MSPSKYAAVKYSIGKNNLPGETFLRATIIPGGGKAAIFLHTRGFRLTSRDTLVQSNLRFVLSGFVPSPSCYDVSASVRPLQPTSYENHRRPSQNWYVVLCENTGVAVVLTSDSGVVLTSEVVSASAWIICVLTKNHSVSGDKKPRNSCYSAILKRLVW